MTCKKISRRRTGGRCARKAQLLTINTSLRLIQYNWIMRTYITPDRLNKMNLNIPDICVKCNFKKGTLFHCHWDCPEIRKFWNKVIKCISQMTLNPVPDCPALCRWLKELSACLVLENEKMRKKSAKFDEIWNPFLVFLKNCQVENNMSLTVNTM